MKIGDLVQLRKKHCKDYNRMALVVKTAGNWSVFIAFIDSGEQVRVLAEFLVVINESR